MAHVLRNWKFVVGGVTVYAGATGAGYLYMLSLKDPDPISTSFSDREKVYDSIASDYDKEMHYDEEFLGINKLRRNLVQKAKGRVLEVAAGTGRNLVYYPTEGVELTLTDASAPMLEAAKAKAETVVPKLDVAQMRSEALEYDDDTFDTVVDTFGLCSFDDPVVVLREMSRVCKPDGTILLLEHGRSRYWWMSAILDHNANKHAKRWGCVWNKDIEGLVADAGLRVLNHSSHHLGTCFVIEAAPPAAVDGGAHTIQTKK